VIEVVTIDTPWPVRYRSATPTTLVSPAGLAEIALTAASRPREWLSLVRYQTGRRWYKRLEWEGHELWLLSWLPGQHTGFHDHGTSAGAFAVASGSLVEQAAPGGLPEPSGRTFSPGAVKSFGSAYIHDVRNDSAWPAVSIHAYSPPLSSMRRYEVVSGGVLQVTGEDREW
jgi:Cysteine dioxygenase type I